jgi:hypothetical protein
MLFISILSLVRRLEGLGRIRGLGSIQGGGSLSHRDIYSKIRYEPIKPEVKSEVLGVVRGKAVVF